MANEFFISYSRKDKEFVKQPCQRLKQEICKVALSNGLINKEIIQTG